MLRILAERLRAIHRNSDLILALIVVCIIALLVIPLKPIVLDAFISLSIVLAITTLLITLYTEDPLAFNSFPSLLLFITLFRLGLNIATTRMILTEAQAGQIIKTFGEFVTGGNQLVGFVLFTLLTGINFVVITKGSGRVAEVAARFTLDAMPGKQMSIDSDLSAGIINQHQAQIKREKIIAEADFYGAMDGASKFVRGDAIAGIVIIFVNIIGGFLVGMLQNGMDFHSVMQVYMTLTIGDGLVTQIPALLISVGAGIIVTRSSSVENLGILFRQQLFNNPRVLTITASILLMLGFMPGMPLMVMAPICMALYSYAYTLSKYPEKEPPKQKTSEGGETGATKEVSEAERILNVDPMELELGNNLTPFADASQENNLLRRISLMRRQIASELGIVVPYIRISDNKDLDPNSYIIKIKGNEIATGTLRINSYLAMHPESREHHPLPGISITEPIYGLPALWIAPHEKEIAEREGYIVMDSLTVLTAHLTEVIRSHAHELLNRQEVARLVENAKVHGGPIMEEILPNLSVGHILKILKNLLKERVSIRDIPSILEILADNSPMTTDVEVLTENVRQGLARGLSKPYLGENRTLYAITLDPKLEEMMLESLKSYPYGKQIVMHPVTIQKLVKDLNRMINEASYRKVHPVLLTTAAIRPYVKKLIEREIPRLPTLSYQEIVTDIPIKPLGMVGPDILIHS